MAGDGDVLAGDITVLEVDATCLIDSSVVTTPFDTFKSSILGEFEIFLLTLCCDVITLWDFPSFVVGKGKVCVIETIKNVSRNVGNMSIHGHKCTEIDVVWMVKLKT